METIESFDYQMKDPYADFGPDDFDREEDVKECPLCDGKGYDELLSECCGATREPDWAICYECRDHCDPATCPDCDGTGIKKP